VVGIYIYMLRCADGSYYVGSATGHDLSTRIDQHNAGSYRDIHYRGGRSFSYGLNISIELRTELPSNAKSKAGAGPRRKL